MKLGRDPVEDVVAPARTTAGGLAFAAAAIAGLLTLSACPGPDDPADSGPDVDDADTTSYDTRGERLYREPFQDGNSFSCSTCHALDSPAADGMIRPGHPIGNATARPSYKNGQFQRMLPAVNSCRTEWMNLDAWSSSSDDWQTLRSWLETQNTTSDAPAVDFDVVSPPDDLSGGDAQKGRELFNDRCAVCHGRDAEGTNKAPALPRNTLQPTYVAGRIRLSGESDSGVYENLTGGQMPFWSRQRLSDRKLRHIVAWVSGSAGGDTGPDASDTSGDTGVSDTSDSPDTLPPPDVSSNCSKTHRKVGWTAPLQGNFHNVGGTARIVDDCTVVIQNFTYDGRGIVVEAYGAPKNTSSSFSSSNGFSMSENLVRSEPYDGEQLVLKLPQSKSLSDLGALSIWCVDVGANFGSGAFGP